VAHCGLGRVSLRRGDVAAACRSLLDAGDTVSDPVTSSYGPRLSLAKELLAAGENEVVLTFLKKRAERRKVRQGEIESWIEAIESGQIPDWDHIRDEPS
jgi:hypothetical protein